MQKIFLLERKKKTAINFRRRVVTDVGVQSRV